MPFGLMNAAQTFQRDKLFCSLPFVFVYLDDILIASRSKMKHLDHLQQLFAILQKSGLQINLFSVKPLLPSWATTPAPRSRASGFSHSVGLSAC